LRQYNADHKGQKFQTLFGGVAMNTNRWPWTILAMCSVCLAGGLYPYKLISEGDAVEAKLIGKR
jgi:hypothetical protein